MKIKIGDKTYKLIFVKRPCRYWSYEYHILLRAVKNTVWDKYIGYIGKTKHSIPFMAFKNLPIIYGNFKDLKRKAKQLLIEEYGE